MISELSGFVLSRTVPDSMLTGVLTGAYKVYGGVVRDQGGRIVAHLINSNVPSVALSNVAAPFSAIGSLVNAFQLHRIGLDVSQLIVLAKGTMAMSGISLAASTAGFYFLNRKLSSIASTLSDMARDVKSIKRILELDECARLSSALKDIGDLSSIKDGRIREGILISKSQVLGEIHEKYRMLLESKEDLAEFMTVEEYYTITAVGAAMCKAELGLLGQAASEFKCSNAIWKKCVSEHVKEKIITNEPQRLLGKKYAGHITVEEIIDWGNFANGRNKGIEYIDELRSTMSPFHLSTAISKAEANSLGVARKLVARNYVLEGFVSQFNYFSDNSLRPSQVHAYISSLGSDESDGIHLFVAKSLVGSML